MNIIEQFTRAYSDITDREAARILGVRNRSAVSQWRSGKRTIPAYILKSIKLHIAIPEAHRLRIKEELDI